MNLLYRAEGDQDEPRMGLPWYPYRQYEATRDGVLPATRVIPLRLELRQRKDEDIPLSPASV